MPPNGEQGSMSDQYTKIENPSVSTEILSDSEKAPLSEYDRLLKELEKAGEMADDKLRQTMSDLRKWESLGIVQWTDESKGFRQNVSYRFQVPSTDGQAMYLEVSGDPVSTSVTEYIGEEEKGRWMFTSDGRNNLSQKVPFGGIISISYASVEDDRYYDYPNAYTDFRGTSDTGYGWLQQNLKSSLVRERYVKTGIPNLPDPLVGGEKIVKLLQNSKPVARMVGSDDWEPITTSNTNSQPA
jgi:hypothetical protein